MSQQYSCGIGKGADLRLEHAALVFERREEYDDSYLLGRRALPKEGLRAPGVEAHVGELYLADISVPPSLYAEPALALQVEPLFAQSEILRLR
jgi:hypothetical protein